MAKKKTTKKQRAGTSLEVRCVRHKTKAYGPEYGIKDTRTDLWHGQGFPDRETAQDAIRDMRLLPKWRKWVTV
jgi:hypothetical protein